MNRFSLARIIRCRLFLLVLCATLSLSAGQAGAALSGDCDQSGSVSLAEVQSSINMFLGTKAVNACVDVDSSGTVSLAEVKRTFDDYIGLLPAALQVNGSVKDPSRSDAIVQFVTVKVYLSGATTPLKTQTTPSSGAVTVTGLASGQAYNFVFSKTGYTDITYYNVTPSHLSVTDLGSVRMLPDTLATQTADINGYIARAEDNSIFPYARLEFRAGVGNTTGEIVVSKSADVEGYYVKTMPAGIYTATVIDTSGGDPAYWKTVGSYTVYAVPGVNTLNNSQNYAAATGLGTPRYRAVLSWGNAPYDLDFHLTGPVAPDDLGTTIGDPPLPRFHIEPTPTQLGYAYSSATPDLPNRPGTLTEAYLDFDFADHGTDNGSETLTILTQRTGTYKFYVFKNSPDAQPLGTSGAQVKLYKGAQLVQTFNVPVASGNTWHVFNLDGDTVTTVGTLSTNTSSSSLLKRIPGAPFDETTLFKQIVKVPRVRTE